MTEIVTRTTRCDACNADITDQPHLLILGEDGYGDPDDDGEFFHQHFCDFSCVDGWITAGEAAACDNFNRVVAKS